jgi:Sigma-54 interaction domain
MSAECYYSLFMRASPAPSKPVVASHPVLSLPHVRVLDPVDLDLIIFGRSNALFCGPGPVLKAALAALQPHLATPVQRADASKFSLPAISSGTWILEHVAACSPSQQQSLYEWLDTARQVQVIATTEPRLIDLVESGGFSSRLYYRLNTIYLDFHLPA